MTTILTRDSDGRSIVLDVVTQFTVSPSATVSRHPVEEGVNIVDHRHRENDRIDLVCRVSMSPLDSIDGNETGIERVEKVWNFLNEVGSITRDDRGTVTLSSDSDKIETIEDLMLVQWPKTVGRMNGAGFQLGFVQINTASVRRVVVPDRAVTSSGSSKNKGEGGTNDPTDSDVATAKVLLNKGGITKAGSGLGAGL